MQKKINEREAGKGRVVGAGGRGAKERTPQHRPAYQDRRTLEAFHLVPFVLWRLCAMADVGNSTIPVESTKFWSGSC